MFGSFLSRKNDLRRRVNGLFIASGRLSFEPVDIVQTAHLLHLLLRLEIWEMQRGQMRHLQTTAPEKLAHWETGTDPQ